MKKTLFIALAAAASFAVHAQNVDFGLKGGLNLASWTTNSNGAGYQNRLAYHVGGLAQINLTPQIAVQPEVVYSSQGTKYTLGSNEHSLALNYINIPVMVQAKIGSGVYAEAGPQIGFLTSVSDKINSTETNYFTTQDFKNTDVALGFGLGFQGSSGIGVDARYNLGLTNINNAGSNDIKNNVLQIGLFLKLNGTRSRR
ncbi:porin family protein [Flavisolibacter ginsenosidimutans]|uniref:PorT family protein n=1 Tax=Flavisolibacter ginsenosidimutans TaxID=661481 RepID=A0A5B8UEZ5_9BACT|nr:porin family protein [Flavisolibacter ginsenosidimutans]QEC54680.1 PorT family protein [Flavisolibacter ginsenosidimutans]